MQTKTSLIMIFLILVVSITLSSCNTTKDINIETQAKEKVNNLISAFENEDTSSMDNILAPGFEWFLNGNEITSNKEEYINMMRGNFEDGATIENIDYTDLTISVENDSYVKISGRWLEDGTDKEGNEANYDNDNTFHIKKIDGKWLITKLETVSNE